MPSARLRGDEGDEDAGDGGLIPTTPLGRLRSVLEADRAGIEGALTTLSAVARASLDQVEVDIAAWRTSTELEGAVRSVVEPITGERSSSGGVTEGCWRESRVERYEVGETDGVDGAVRERLKGGRARACFGVPSSVCVADGDCESIGCSGEVLGSKPTTWRSGEPATTLGTVESTVGLRWRAAATACAVESEAGSSTHAPSSSSGGLSGPSPPPLVFAESSSSLFNVLSSSSVNARAGAPGRMSTLVDLARSS